MSFNHELQNAYKTSMLLGLNCHVNSKQYREMVGLAVIEHLNIMRNADNIRSPIQTDVYSQKVSFTENGVEIKSQTREMKEFTISMSEAFFKKLLNSLDKDIDVILEQLFIKSEGNIHASLPIMRNFVFQALNNANYMLNENEVLLGDYWFDLNLIDSNGKIIPATVNIGDFDGERKFKQLPFTIYALQNNGNGTYSTDMSQPYFTGYLNYNLLSGMILSNY